jgi:hypothetical protein
MTPKINYANKTIKLLNKIKKGTSNNLSRINEKSKLKLALNELRKKNLLIERTTLKKLTISKINDIKSIDNRLINDLKGFKIIISNPKLNKKEQNEIIKEELKGLMKKRKQNKTLISKIEVEEEIIKSTNILIKKVHSREVLEALDAYYSLINYIEGISKIQFGISNKRYIFESHALREITSLLQKSNNIPLTFKEIYHKLNKK